MNQVEFQIQTKDVYKTLDIDSKTTFSINLKQAELTNPTIVKTPYSNQISIPKTKLNCRIFACIGIQSTVAIVNPLNLINFRLYINGSIFQAGYIVIEEIDIEENGYYRIRLYGSLGNFFARLNDIPLNTLPLDCTHTVNAENVLDLMINDNGLYSYAVTYQGQYDKFDPKKMQTPNYEIKDAIWSNGLTGYTDVDLDENRRQTFFTIGEYRSYYQKPVLKFRPILETIKAQLEELDYKMELDETFFVDENPYYNDLWLMCKNIEVSDIKGGVGFNIETFGDTGGTRSSESDLKIEENQAKDKNSKTIGIERFKSINRDASIDCEILISDPIEVASGETINAEFNVQMIATFYDNSKDDQRFRYKKKDLTCSLMMIDENGNVIQNASAAQNVGADTPVSARVFNDNNVVNKRPSNRDSSYFGEQNFAYDSHPLDVGRPEHTIDGETSWKYSLSMSSTISQKVRVIFKVQGVTYWGVNGGSKDREYGVAFKVLDSSRIIVKGQVNPDDNRTNSRRTFSDLIGSEYSCYDLLLTYCKIFGLLFKLDVVNNTIKILLRDNFYDEKVIDWTERIDRSKQFSLEPLAFKFRTGIFKYPGLGTKYERAYSDKTKGKEYGSFQVNTGYKIDDTQNNYLDGIIFDNAVVASDYSQYFAGRSTIALRDDKQLVHLQDKDVSRIDQSGFIPVFRDGVQDVRRATITDDTDLMLSQGVICWNETLVSGAKVTFELPKFVRTLKTDNDVYSLNFGTPSVNWSDSENEQTQNSGIYAKYWRAYIDDRLDNNCKLLTCYVFLTPTDVNSDLLGRFIYIDGALWVIDKVSSFNPLSDAATKVVLIKVKDMNNYLHHDNIADTFKVEYNGELIYDNADGNSPAVIVVEEGVASVTLNLDSSVRWEASSTLVIDKTSGEAGQENITMNLPVNMQRGNIRFQYSGVTVTINIVRDKMLNVIASVENGTGALINGEASPLQIRAGSTITLSATGSTEFLYWTINGVKNNTRAVVMNVTEDVTAIATFLAGGQIRMYCDDVSTTCSGVERVNNYFVLNTGQSYMFSNSRADFSGFLFAGDETFSKSGSKTITQDMNKLSVYYSQVLINATIINKSTDKSFEGDNIYCGNQSFDFEVLPGVTKKDTFNFDPDSTITFDKLPYHYPSFSATTFPTPSVYDLTITGYPVGWQGDVEEDIATNGGVTISRTVYSPIPFTIQSDLNVTPKQGSANTSISIPLTGTGGAVMQKVGGFEYILTLNQKSITAIGWSGTGAVTIQASVAATATSATAVFYHNNIPLTLSTGLSKGGNTASADGSVYSTITATFTANAGSDRQLIFTVTANGTAYIWTVSQAGTGSGVTRIIAGSNVSISPSSGVGNVTINALGSGAAYVESSQDKYNTPWLLTNNNYIAGSTLYTPFKRLVGGLGINVLSPYGSPDITLELAVKTSRWSRTMYNTSISANLYYMQLISGTGFSTIHAVIPTIIFASNSSYPVSVQMYSGSSGWYVKVQNCSNNEVVIPSGTVLTALIFGV